MKNLDINAEITGDSAVLTCRGKITLGDEVQALHRMVFKAVEEGAKEIF